MPRGNDRSLVWDVTLTPFPLARHPLCYFLSSAAEVAEGAKKDKHSAHGERYYSEPFTFVMTGVLGPPTLKVIHPEGHPP